MKLISFEVGSDRPFFLIAGPCVIESEALVIDVAGRLKEMTSRARYSIHFQGFVRQGQSFLAGELPRSRPGGRPEGSGESS